MKQLDTAKTNAPGCSFNAMDAAKLGFRDQSFDTVICVEAAFHFDTRESFLREAYRVLNAGGHLLMTDILFHRWIMKEDQLLVKDNYLRNIEEYHETLRNVGFRDIRIEDATEVSWRRFLKQLAVWGINESFKHKSGLRAYVNFIVYLFFGFISVKNYVLVCARKERE
jgi:ubiquinone/menaquinone biosynthesis C-methylase UbiE